MDIHQTVTAKIIAMLEKNRLSSSPRWSANSGNGMPINAKTGEAYRGINVLILWSEMAEKGYANSQWLTYNHAASLGGQVRKGEKSVACVYYKTVAKECREDPEDAETYFLAKPFWLFNVAQIDHLPEGLFVASAEREFNAIASAEGIIARTNAQICYGFDSAFYSPLKDQICLPQRERFASEEIFYATALHELTHWTGHESRLNRQFGKRFGDDAYAVEELVAELGAAFTTNSLGLLSATIDSHASYVASWVKVLKSDKTAIFKAASLASKAADFLISSPLEITQQPTRH
jgi:antirestriction protein ArdC